MPFARLVCRQVRRGDAGHVCRRQTDAMACKAYSAAWQYLDADTVLLTVRADGLFVLGHVCVQVGDGVQPSCGWW